MRVLICDDDASSRFVANRMLTRIFGCTTSECANGVEALARINNEPFDFVMLDLEMPHLDGVGVVRAVRGSGIHRALPIIVISKEPRQDVIAHLIGLGISGYLLKPVDHERLMSTLERIKRSVPERRQVYRPPVDVSSLRLSPDVPGLVVDGSLDYRRFFATEAGRYGPIKQAASGAAAIAKFRQAPATLVFIGEGLGVVGADQLIPQLRAIAGHLPVRVVWIGDPAEVPFDCGVTDVMGRARSARALRSELRPFVKTVGVLANLVEVAGDLSGMLSRAAAEVLHAHLGVAVERREPHPDADHGVSATVDVLVRGQWPMTIGVHASRQTAGQIAGALLQVDPTSVTEGDLLASLVKIANLMTEHVRASLVQRSVETTSSAPLARVRSLGIREPDEAEGFLQRLAVGALGELVLTVMAGDCRPEPAQALAETPAPETPATA